MYLIAIRRLCSTEYIQVEFYHARLVGGLFILLLLMGYAFCNSRYNRDCGDTATKK